MKNVRLKAIRIVAVAVFVFAFILNIHTNLNGDTTFFGQLLVGQTGGSTGTGTGTGNQGTGTGNEGTGEEGTEGESTGTEGTGTGDDSGTGTGTRCSPYDYDDMLLKTVTCVLPWQQSLQCKEPMPNKCCKADSQKACNGSGWPPIPGT